MRIVELESSFISLILLHLNVLLYALALSSVMDQVSKVVIVSQKVLYFKLARFIKSMVCKRLSDVLNLFGFRLQALHIEFVFQGVCFS